MNVKSVLRETHRCFYWLLESSKEDAVLSERVSEFPIRSFVENFAKFNYVVKLESRQKNIKKVETWEDKVQRHTRVEREGRHPIRPALLVLQQNSNLTVHCCFGICWLKAYSVFSRVLKLYIGGQDYNLQDDYLNAEALCYFKCMVLPILHCVLFMAFFVEAVSIKSN
ncbi:hypothetical protein SDJN02_18746, partial [Cucurbita argyrosperma subsp. argyrosperma]